MYSLYCCFVEELNYTTLSTVFSRVWICIFGTGNSWVSFKLENLSRRSSDLDEILLGDIYYRVLRSSYFLVSNISLFRRYGPKK